MFQQPKTFEAPPNIELHRVSEQVVLILLSNPISIIDFGATVLRVLNQAEKPQLILAMLRTDAQESFKDIFNKESLASATVYWSHPMLMGLIFTARNPLVKLALDIVRRMRKGSRKIVMVSSPNELKNAYIDMLIANELGSSKGELLLGLLAALPDRPGES